MPIYTLYLKTNLLNSPYIIRRTTRGQSVTWQVNFDDLFRGNNYKYKNCRISSQMGWSFVSNSLQYDSIFGYVAIDFYNPYNASTTNGCIIDVFNIGNTDIGSSLCKFRQNTFGSKGIDISMPYGNTQITINLIQPSGSSLLSVPLFTLDYDILLKFELY